MPKGVYDRAKAKPRASQREQIVRAALGVYAHYGFEGASLERMAEAAGVSKALLHSHFGDKQGLVRAIADLAVRQNLARIRQIDATPSLRLRAREELIFAAYREARQEWRVIEGTLLVPNFQFALRQTIEDYLDEERQSLLRYRDEFREPTPETLLAYAYTMLALRRQYVQDGRESEYRLTRQRQFECFLLPESCAT